MSKIQKGATVVLKLDDLFLWMRKKKQEEERQLKQQTRRGRTRQRVRASKPDPYRLFNRNYDYKELPPCRAKIVYMGHPRFLRRRKLVFGLQLYPPYFGQSGTQIRKQFSDQVIGEIPKGQVSAPEGSIWFVTEDQIKGVMLRENEKEGKKKRTSHRRRRSSIGSTTDLTVTEMVAPSHLSTEDNVSTSSLPDLFSIDEKRRSQQEVEAILRKEEERPQPRRRNGHTRRRSSISMATHMRNMSSIANIPNLDSLFYEDTLPSTYDVSGPDDEEKDPANRRFRVEEWLQPVFLDSRDEESLEIVFDRASWELAQWIKDQRSTADANNLALIELLEYMATVAENYDQLSMTVQHADDDKDDVEENASGEGFKRGSLEEKFAMLFRIKEIMDVAARDKETAARMLLVLDIFDHNILVAAALAKQIMPHVENDLKFMLALRNSGIPFDKQHQVLATMDRFNEYQSELPRMWQLVNYLEGNESYVKRVLSYTNNGREDDSYMVMQGVLEAVSAIKDAVPIFELLTQYKEDTKEGEEYINAHMSTVVSLYQKSRPDRVTSSRDMVKLAVEHPLISPYELFNIWRQVKSKPVIDRYNVLAARQVWYEQCQLFLGRYLFYRPKEEEEDGSQGSNLVMLELTVDIDNVNPRTGQYDKKCVVKKCRAERNASREYEPVHYFAKEVERRWEVVSYAKKILKLDEHKFQWLPNLEVESQVLRQLEIEAPNPATLENYMRGYLLYTGGKREWRRFQSLLQELSDSPGDVEHRHMMKSVEEKPLFVCVEKWNLYDCNQ